LLSTCDLFDIGFVPLQIVGEYFSLILPISTVRARREPVSRLSSASTASDKCSERRVEIIEVVPFTKGTYYNLLHGNGKPKGERQPRMLIVAIELPTAASQRDFWGVGLADAPTDHRC
jgi:hypothetical protein